MGREGRTYWNLERERHIERLALRAMAVERTQTSRGNCEGEREPREKYPGFIFLLSPNSSWGSHWPNPVRSQRVQTPRMWARIAACYVESRVGRKERDLGGSTNCT